MIKKPFKELIALSGLTIVAYLLLSYYTNLGLALVFLLLYLGLTGRWYRDFLISIFRLSGNWLTHVLASFLSLFVFSSLISPFVLFWRLTNWEICLVFFLNGLLAWYLKRLSTKGELIESRQNDLGSEVTNWQFMPGKFVGVWVYIILFALGLYLLQSSLTTEGLDTPWRVINQEYFLYIYILATFVLGLNIFSKLSNGWTLVLLILHTFLTVSYLPLTQVLIYGADGWRHMAMETQIMESGRIALVDFGSGFNAIVNALNPGRFSYAWFWGLGVVMTKITGVTLLEVNKWLGPILWAVGFPILLYTLFKNWFKKDRLALLLIWLSFIFFAFQVGGAFTLPVNTGFLFFLLLLVLLQAHFTNPGPGQKWFLGLLGFLSLFGYLVYFILFFLAWVVGEVMVRRKQWQGRASSAAAVLLAVGIGIVIPLLEWLFNYSQIGKINVISQIQQVVGNFTGFYLATGPRPHDILTGNILFNQTPSYSYIGNFLTEEAWWLVLVAMVIWSVVVWGVIYSLRKRQEIGWGIFFLAMFISLLLGRYFLTGEQILSRRIDLVFALGTLFFLAFLFDYILTKWKIEESRPKRLTTIIFILLFSLATTASYTLGPDTKSVSLGEYNKMQAVWEEEKEKDVHCVLADTYPLLALEAISGKKIVGGGFPMNAYFAQPERVELWEKWRETGRLSEEDWAWAKQLTGAKDCQVVGSPNIRFNNLMPQSFGKGKGGEYN